MSYTLLIFISLSIMGGYVYYRNQESNTYLAGQLAKNINEQSRYELQAISDYHTSQLDNFFYKLKVDITYLGTTLGNALSQENKLSLSHYWDASTALRRLDNGSWDNPNTETA
ncbi:MAG: hypothetical protein NZL98_09995, partial [Anaerolineales bacterium]|nr:hypothetical protein [Anaerolineales bacterium]